MKPFALSDLHESQGHLRQQFVEFAGVWQSAKSAWRDQPARQFEQRHLQRLSPTLQRVTAAADAFADSLRTAESALKDPETSSDDF